mgnify:CR=1 FL=1
MVQTIRVKDHDDIITITYEDLLKYHGKQMLGGVALAFQIIDAVEMVMRVKTHQKLELDTAYAEDKCGQVAPNGGRYYFEIGYKQKNIKLYLKEGIIPQEFITYSKLAQQCKEKQIAMQKEDQQKLLALRKELAKSIIEAKSEELFVIMA